MRIGFNFQTNYTDISGVEYYGLGLLNGLLNIDRNNHYIIYTNQPKMVSEYIKKSDRLNIVSFKYLKTRIARILWEHFQLPRLSIKHNLDILHCSSYICPMQKIRVPYIVTIHDTIAIDKPQWCKLSNSLYYNCFLGASAKKADSVISVSQQTAEDIKRNFELPYPKIHVVYSGIDKIFNPDKDIVRQTEVRKRYNLPEKYILYVGNIEPKKNISTLLSVQKELKQKGLEHKLVIAGRRTWKTKEELSRIFREIKSDNIVWAGYVQRSDLPYIYQMADVFVFLSLYEGFGFPPLEAMACGTPVVSTVSGALRETVADAALIVNPFQVGQISDAIISLINDLSLRGKYIEMGIRQSKRFNWDTAAKETLSIYEKALLT